MGYHHSFAAQGDDWGAALTAAIGAMAAVGCVGIHLNMAKFSPQPGDEAVALRLQLFGVPPIQDALNLRKRPVAMAA